MNLKKHHPFGQFFIQMQACEVQLPDFLQGPKKGFKNSKAHILQSMQWKFLKFFPHVLKSAHYKILQLHVSKNVFFIQNLVLVLEMAVWEHFCENIIKEL